MFHNWELGRGKSRRHLNRIVIDNLEYELKYLVILFIYSIVMKFMTWFEFREIWYLRVYD